MPTALVQGRIAVQYTDLLKKYLTDNWDVLVWDPAKNDPSEFPAMAAKADCIVGGSIPSKQWPAIPNLKLFQIPWTGYDFCSPQTKLESNTLPSNPLIFASTRTLSLSSRPCISSATLLTRTLDGLISVRIGAFGSALSGISHGLMGQMAVKREVVNVHTPR